MADDTALVQDLLPEWRAFRDAALPRPFEEGTACEAWTVGDIVAHQAGNAEELDRVLRAHLAGDRVGTRTFEEREAPFRAMPPQRRWEALEARIEQLARAVEQGLDADPESQVEWTGRLMRVRHFGEHMREELVIHRWDIAGDDAVSTDLLGATWFTVHSVEAVGAPLLKRGIERLRHQEFTGRIRVEAREDIVVSAGETPSIALQARDGGADIETDAAARALLIWGRQPADCSRWRSDAGAERLQRLRLLLSGY